MIRLSLILQSPSLFPPASKVFYFELPEKHDLWPQILCRILLWFSLFRREVSSNKHCSIYQPKLFRSNSVAQNLDTLHFGNEPINQIRSYSLRKMGMALISLLCRGIVGRSFH